MTRVVITPHSDYEPAIKATIATLESLHGAGFEHTDTRDGLIFGTAANADFLKWASDRQGYAALVEVEVNHPLADDPRETPEAVWSRSRPLKRPTAPEPPTNNPVRGLSPDLARKVNNPDRPMLYTATGATIWPKR